jgi:hypothetical protein
MNSELRIDLLMIKIIEEQTNFNFLLTYEVILKNILHFLLINIEIK